MNQETLDLTVIHVISSFRAGRVRSAWHGYMLCFEPSVTRRGL